MSEENQGARPAGWAVRAGRYEQQYWLKKHWDAKARAECEAVALAERFPGMTVDVVPLFEAAPLSYDAPDGA